MASHPVYAPWFHRAISKSVKRNVRPLSRFVWLRCMTFRLVKSLSLAHQSTRHRKDTRNKALGSTLKTLLQWANDLDCRGAPRRRKAFRCARGGKADGVFGIGISDSCFRRIALTNWRVFCQTRRRQADLNQAEDNSPLGSSLLPDLLRHRRRRREDHGGPTEPIALGTGAKFCKH